MLKATSGQRCRASLREIPNDRPDYRLVGAQHHDCADRDLHGGAGGIYALRHLPLDAIPDLSDTQVIVYTPYPGQAPQVVEDQVTYPLSSAMLTVPKSKVVRGFSFFGVSFVYIIFEDGTDIYWARSRVLEYLNAAASRLPSGVTPVLVQTRPAWAGSTNTPSPRRI